MDVKLDDDDDDDVSPVAKGLNIHHIRIWYGGGNSPAEEVSRFRASLPWSELVGVSRQKTCFPMDRQLPQGDKVAESRSSTLCCWEAAVQPLINLGRTWTLNWWWWWYPEWTTHVGQSPFLFLPPLQQLVLLLLVIQFPTEQKHPLRLQALLKFCVVENNRWSSRFFYRSNINGRLQFTMDRSARFVAHVNDR